MKTKLNIFFQGYTEIEYRISSKSINWIPLYSSVGTIERLKEFIRYIVSSNGSRKILSQMQETSEIAHIAPQIGTLLTALAVEQQELRLFKMEDFDLEWKRLSKESGFKELVDAYKPQFLGHHKSSSDPFNTTYIAKLYFDEYIQLNHNKTQYIFDHKKVKPNEVYFRALCRVYLIDFVCTDYKLPPICVDLITEFDILVDNYTRDNPSSTSFWNYSRKNIIFRWITDSAAFIVCYLSRSPECEFRLLYGSAYIEDD